MGALFGNFWKWWIMPKINTLFPGKGSHSKTNILHTHTHGIISHCTEKKCMTYSLTIVSIGYQSSLVELMAWCRQAASHYLNQCLSALRGHIMGQKKKSVCATECVILQQWQLTLIQRPADVMNLCESIILWLISIDQKHPPGAVYYSSLWSVSGFTLAIVEQSILLWRFV